MAAYGASYREQLGFAGIVIGGLLLGIVITVGLSQSIDSLWLLAPLMVPFLGGIALAVWRMHAMKRARKNAILAMLRADAFEVDLAPTPDRAETVFSPVQHLERLLDLRGGSSRIDWIALQGASTLVFEHEHVTGSGKTTAVHTTTVIAYSAAHPTLPGARMGTEPLVWTERAALLRARVLRAQSGVIALGDETFDRVWVTAGSAATARQLFTSRARERLAESPRGEVWVAGQGFVCCAYRGGLSADQLSRMLEHSRAVLSR